MCTPALEYAVMLAVLIGGVPTPISHQPSSEQTSLSSDCLGAPDMSSQLPISEGDASAFWVTCNDELVAGELVTMLRRDDSGSSGTIVDGSGMLGLSVPPVRCPPGSSLQIYFHRLPTKKTSLEILTEENNSIARRLTTLALPPSKRTCLRINLRPGSYVLWISATWESLSVVRQYRVTVASERGRKEEQTKEE